MSKLVSIMTDIAFFFYKFLSFLSNIKLVVIDTETSNFFMKHIKGPVVQN